MRYTEFKLTEAESDPKVAELQTQLKAKGYNLGTFGDKGDGIDGILGPWTEAALAAFTAKIPPEKAKTPPVGTPNTPSANTSSYGFGIKPDKPSGTGIRPDAGGIGLKLPVAGGRISDTFGSRGGAHNGVDIAVPIGTPVQSPLSGVVSRTGSDNLNGNFVVVKSGNEENFFLHLSQIKVSNGQQIKKGDVVGLSGNTGKSTGPHLHWEKHVAGRPVNPMA